MLEGGDRENGAWRKLASLPSLHYSVSDIDAIKWRENPARLLYDDLLTSGLTIGRFLDAVCDAGLYRVADTISVELLRAGRVPRRPDDGQRSAAASDNGVCEPSPLDGGQPGRVEDTRQPGRVEDTRQPGRVEDTRQPGRVEDTGQPGRGSDGGQDAAVRDDGPARRTEDNEQPGRRSDGKRDAAARDDVRAAAAGDGGQPGTADDDGARAEKQDGVRRGASTTERRVDSIGVVYDESCVLGRGGFGCVYLGRFVADGNGRQVAVKVLRGGAGGASFEAEVTRLREYRHANLLRIRAYSYDGTQRHLVYEFMPNGSLQDRLRCRNNTEDHLILNLVITIF
ncbi:PREDICTED: uncharacterized protein LOC106819981 [Priapulus caudatus]|uniref:non-specific serine/threonine protein kinase n=1 Tax=Priapulus caudatus TaxID=37621 RepID=A0ABM1F6F9_PRICU|nr:PREDICTED: uncharacterized protein LOC106819981 [Priapulus caudatus]